MTDPVKPLNDDEVAEIERIIESSPCATFPMTTEEARALCATVRALRTDYALVENYLAEIKRELGLPPNTVLGVTLENYKERVTAPLRERLARCEGSRRVHELDNHHNALACGYCAGPIKEEITRLQSQLAQVTQERDEYRQREESERKAGNWGR